MALFVDRLAGTMVLGALLDELKKEVGAYDLVAHWTQGEFHHDLVLRVPPEARTLLPGVILVVATNCNGGVKEVLSFSDVRVDDDWPAPSGTTAALR